MACWRKQILLPGLAVLLLFSSYVDGGSGHSRVPATYNSEKSTCNSIEIQHAKDFEQWRECRIVVGHVTITNLQLEKSSGPLALNIEEITDYLFVYHVLDVSTLQQLLPQLQLVRGRRLYRDRYALVIYENRDLLDIGLGALLRVQRGTLRIERNPQLCYVHTVDWVALLGDTGERAQQQLIIRNNRSPNHCPSCGSLLDVDAVSSDDASDLNGLLAEMPHCWQQDMPQRTPHNCHAVVNGSCSACDGNCLGECLTPAAIAAGRKCGLCANLWLNGSVCVDVCPANTYQLNRRQCVAATRCVEAGLIPHAGECMTQCPSNYKMVSQGCRLQCTGPRVVHTIEDWAPLSKCEVLNGSLSIELYDTKQPMIEPLERVFARLRVVTGYVRVQRSPQLVSLGFLRGLREIGGEELVNDKYALYVVNNRHLENIWLPDSGQQVNITRGQVFFHLNPRLCDWKINQLQESLVEGHNITALHASPSSNGERMNCGRIGELHATVETVNSTAARIKLEPLSYDDKQLLLGYVYYYREAAHNVSAYDDRHGCGNDAWRMDTVRGENVRHIISGLKPSTRYAFSVRTLTIIVTHPQLEAFSKVFYFVTLPSKPGPVGKIYARSILSSEIEVHWWPPRYPNGRINQYFVTCEEIVAHTSNDNSTTIDTKKEISNKTTSSNIRSEIGECECPDMISTLSGPAPIDEDYFNREQQTFDEAMPNLIYVPVKKISDDEQCEMQLLMQPNDTNTTNQTALEQNIDDDSGYQKLRQYQHTLALATQDTGTADFPIMGPINICSVIKPTDQYRLNHDCDPIEQINSFSVSGKIYNYTIGRLKPDTTYRVTVRACVEGIYNGCGPITELHATTVDKSVEIVLQQYGHLFH